MSLGPCRSVFVCLRAGWGVGHWTVQQCDLWWGLWVTLEFWAPGQLETKAISRPSRGAGDCRSATWAARDENPLNTLDTQGLGDLPWLTMLCALSHFVAGRRSRIIHGSTERQRGVSVWTPVGPALCCPLGWFHLYPFPVISLNHDFVSFHCVPWVLLANYQTWRWLGGDPWTCSCCQKWGWSLWGLFSLTVQLVLNALWTVTSE